MSCNVVQGKMNSYREPKTSCSSYLYLNVFCICTRSVTQESLPWAAIGGAVFGLSMASIFPLAMSLLPSSGEMPPLAVY